MKKVFVQVQVEQIERKQLAEIAKARHTDMSKVVRKWIRDAYARLEADK